MTQIPSGSQDLSSYVVNFKVNESCIKDVKFGSEIPKISKYAFNGTRNYLIRYKIVDGTTQNHQWYDGYSKSWIDD